MSQKLHVKTGDTVVVISGKDKGKQGKVMKGVRWMPRLLQAMKDVISCEKPR